MSVCNILAQRSDIASIFRNATVTSLLVFLRNGIAQALLVKTSMHVNR